MRMSTPPVRSNSGVRRTGRSFAVASVTCSGARRSGTSGRAGRPRSTAPGLAECLCKTSHATRPGAVERGLPALPEVPDRRAPEHVTEATAKDRPVRLTPELDLTGGVLILI